MTVTYFRQRRPGPEATLEDTVALQIEHLFHDNDWPLWMAGSLPIGAGMPDLVSVWYEPHLRALADFERTTIYILAYLRAIRHAQVDTIAARINHPRTSVQECLDQLLKIQAVTTKQNAFKLAPNWKHILPKIVTVEVKIQDWKKAVQQAVRNRIFAHKSFIALPQKVAHRIRQEPVLRNLGIGVLGVTPDCQVRIIRQAPIHKTTVWSYYFHLATITARHSRDELPCLT